jgi:serine/threonine protein kinase
MPFSGSDPKEIVRKIRAGQYRPLAQAAPNIPEALVDLVSRMLSSNPADRPQTGHDVVAALNDITRRYGIESAASDISEMLSNIFPDEQGEAPAGVIEIVRQSRADLEVSATRRDSATIPSGSLSASLSSSPSPMTPTRVTPSAFSASDVSMSLPRRSSRDILVAPPATLPEPPAVSLRASSWILFKPIVIVVLLVGLSLATYFLVRLW